MATTRKVSVSVTAILLLLAVLSCLLLVHGLYGLLDLFAGSPDLSPPEATLLILFALCFSLLLLAAAGNRRALLPRELPLPTVNAGGGGGQAFPTTTAVRGEEPHQLADEEEMEMVDTAAAARRAGLLQTEDYPGSGPNGRHDPRNPH